MNAAYARRVLTAVTTVNVRESLKYMKMRLGALVLVAAVAMRVLGRDWAKAKLEKSPRHGEWVKVKQGNREVTSFVVYPEVKDKATAVVVIHEIFGLSDWARN